MKSNETGNFGFLIHDVARHMRWHFDRESQGTGLTRAQWSVLAHLRRNDGVQQQALARLMDISAMTLARHVDRLEQEGWVRRQDDPDDRRAKRLYLTEEAAPKINQLQRLARKFLAEAMQGISPEEQAIAKSVLERIRSNLTIGDTQTSDAD